jgi:hypothetical protein
LKTVVVLTNGEANTLFRSIVEKRTLVVDAAAEIETMNETQPKIKVQTSNAGLDKELHRLGIERLEI